MNHSDTTSDPVSDIAQFDVVAFDHPFFGAVQGIWFVTNEETGKPVLRMELDHLEAELPFRGIVRELSLTEDSRDYAMLEIIGKSLNFVPKILIGDPVPGEVYGGEASWELSHEHRIRARTRVSMNLLLCVSEDGTSDSPTDDIETLLEEPEFRDRLRTAYGDVAESLGLDRSESEHVAAMADQLSEEMAYIEALYDIFQDMRIIEDRLKQLGSVYQRSRMVKDNIDQARRLLAIPMDQYKSDFEKVFLHTCDILVMLNDLEPQIAFIRAMRNDLHPRFWAWAPLMKKWRELSVGRSSTSNELVRETCQFLAQRFLPERDWGLYTKDSNDNRKSESIW